MKTTIFYFSATGNSLHFARQLADKLQATQLTSMAETLEKKSTETDAQSIGLVFPVYAWGPPRIVMDFLQRLKFTGQPYFFSVVTCVGIPAKTLFTIRKALREKGAELQAGFVVRAARSSLMQMNALDKIIIRLDRQKNRLQSGEERLKEIVSKVSQQKKHPPESSSWPANVFGTMFHGQGIQYFKKAANSFQLSDDCTGCGSCVRLCPRANILLKNGRPEFGDNCEFCHACIQWCPEFAITHPDFDPELPQYRHPGVKLSAMVVNA